MYEKPNEASLLYSIMTTQHFVSSLAPPPAPPPPSLCRTTETGCPHMYSTGHSISSSVVFARPHLKLEVDKDKMLGTLIVPMRDVVLSIRNGCGRLNFDFSSLIVTGGDKGGDISVLPRPLASASQTYDGDQQRKFPSFSYSSQPNTN